ncbi:MAG: MFS transporter [Euryarchaeota archaeon]|nr:MFS transporter [Euryarchaeota archaeon]
MGERSSEEGLDLGLPEKDPEEKPKRIEIGSWVLYDLANTLFSFVVLSFYFGPWVVEDLGGRDSAVTVTESASMIVVILLAPVLGALSDRTRRMPFLIASTLVAAGATSLLGVGRFLGFGTGTSLVFAVAAFAVANLGFQLGLVFYDALLPSVSTPKTIGKVGAIGVGVGYIGSFIGLGLGAFLLGADADAEPMLFLATGALFVLFSLPCFFFVREVPPRRLEGEKRMRLAISSVVKTLKGLPKDKRTSRFLIGRFLYADAVNTLILILGIYAVTEVGFQTDTLAYSILLGLGILFAVLSAPVWGHLVDHIGPKHTLDLVLLIWMLALGVTIVHPLLDLPRGLFFMIGAVVGIALAGTWSADRPLLVGIAPQGQVGEWFGFYALAGRFAAVTGPLTWALVVDVLMRDHPSARPVAVITILATIVASFIVLRKLDDPKYPDTNPLARFTPWGEGIGRRLSRWYLFPVRAPLTLGFIAVSWAVFLPLAESMNGILVVRGPYEGWNFEIPDLTRAPLDILRGLFVAPWLNHDIIQLVYVTVLLMLFGALFEVREGTLRMLTVFYVATWVGALVAAVLLHGLIQVYPDSDFFRSAWDRSWNGGSVGAFGLMGGLSARARNPWPLLAFFVFWEINVGYWYLRSYTPAFHLTALATGYLLVRYGFRALSDDTTEPAGLGQRQEG